jgi:hypothetical protein
MLSPDGIGHQLLGVLEQAPGVRPVIQPGAGPHVVSKRLDPQHLPAARISTSSLSMTRQCEAIAAELVILRHRFEQWRPGCEPRVEL